MVIGYGRSGIATAAPDLPVLRSTGGQFLSILRRFTDLVYQCCIRYKLKPSLEQEKGYRLWGVES